MSLGFEFDPGLNKQWREAVEAHKAHAVAAWPGEACGVIRPDGEYVAAKNVSKTPLESFEMPQGLFEELDPVAVLHSHPSRRREDGTYDDPHNAPSAADMVSQADTGVPWGITLVVEGGAADPFWFGDEVARPELIGRKFRHGVDDCYSLIRDWHREVPGILIPDFPRDDDWWAPPGEESGAEQVDLYRNGFAEAGFVATGRDAGTILPGDVFLCKIRSPVYNHGGIYIGGGLILHHLAHQLSKRDPAAPWRSKLEFLVRHKDLPDDWVPEKSL